MHQPNYFLTIIEIKFVNIKTSVKENYVSQTPCKSNSSDARFVSRYIGNVSDRFCESLWSHISCHIWSFDVNFSHLLHLTFSDADRKGCADLTFRSTFIYIIFMNVQHICVELLMLWGKVFQKLTVHFSQFKSIQYKMFSDLSLHFYFPYFKYIKLNNLLLILTTIKFFN